jgi:hypothetical protein
MRFPVLLFCFAHLFAQIGPQPPCGAESVAYPAPDSPPIVKYWSDSSFSRNWKPPACTGWTTTGFRSLTVVAARFRYAGDAADLLRKIGTISNLAGIRYWSTTLKQWLTLIVNAHALSNTSELKQGQTILFEQTDNLSGKGLYRMHLAEATEDRIVYDVENVSTMRYYFVTTFHPGDLQTVYFLDREPEGVWRYYSIVRTGLNANRLTAGHEASSINRSVAFYRYLAGIPTDREPPAAR